jgi:hypothetical protein
MPEANLFHLEGHNLHIEYSSTSITGQPNLTYHDANQSLDFTGDQIQTVTTEAGALVSVTIRKTIDTGSTSFSVLIPRTNIEPAGATIHVRTIGITAIHRFSVVPAFNRGQLDTYATTALHGTAETVTF